jgi:hypothetical protein
VSMRKARRRDIQGANDEQKSGNRLPHHERSLPQEKAIYKLQPQAS